MEPLIVASSAALAATAFAATAAWRRVSAAAKCSTGSDEADAIIVMGAAAGPSGPCPELRARLAHAARMYERRLAPVVLCAGGFTRGTSEAAVMVAELERMGVEAANLLGDERSVNTRRAAEAVRRLAGERGWSRVLIVTSPYHVHRALSEMRRQGLAASASCPEQTPLTRRPTTLAGHTLREVVAVLWYGVSPRRAGRRAPA